MEVSSQQQIAYKGMDFHFPVTPYPIQQQFMERLFETIEKKQIGIFESPTGTGKTLSIICGAITWLQYHKQRIIDHIDSGSESDSEVFSDDEYTEEKTKISSSTDDPSWVHEQSKKRKREERRAKQEKETGKQIKRQKRVIRFKKKRSKFLSKAASVSNSEDDDSNLIVDYDSGSENTSSSINMKNVGIRGDLLEGLFSSGSEDEGNVTEENGVKVLHLEEEEEEEEFVAPKIIYCSRTHSQLSQFIKEFKKTKFFNQISLVVLGSRRNYCIHPKVSKIQSINRMNEMCNDLKCKKNGCNFYDQDTLKLYRDHVLVKTRDIEELVSLGKRIECCPYFGTRKAVPSAQILVLPYSSLIHKQTRESLGIESLEDCVVIIDEAHNIIDTVESSHAVKITLAQIQNVFSSLTKYFTKYKLKLKPKNQTRIKQVLSLLSSLIKFLKQQLPVEEEKVKDNSDSSSQTLVITLNDFLFSISADNINMFHVVEFIEAAELVKKLNGFVEKYEAQESNSQDVSIHISDTEYADVSIQTSVHSFVSLLLVLTNINQDGKMIVERNFKSPSQSFIKFILLNPSVYFADLVKEARSVILAGGTMEPISSLQKQLFPNEMLSKYQKQINIFQCNHVIPDSNILPICLSKGPSNIDFEFTFQTRESKPMIEEMGRLVLNLCNVVPDGIVIFFPSYKYEETVYDIWKSGGILQKLEQKKKLFRESKHSSNVETILHDYKFVIDHNFSDTIKSDKFGSYKGAMLSCVVGGKMSEGINFSDGYARLVIVVGLPYPNVQDLELKEKMNYLDKNVKKLDGFNSKEYYEGLCMKAVNQSIGRSIRHAKDYAGIILLDKRYCQNSLIRSKLPKWIQSRLTVWNDFSSAFSSISQFFKGKQVEQQSLEQLRKQSFYLQQHK